VEVEHSERRGETAGFWLLALEEGKQRRKKTSIRMKTSFIARLRPLYYPEKIKPSGVK